jgi:5-methyltetrahydrofolate--homocysteine methyltransferase
MECQRRPGIPSGKEDAMADYEALKQAVISGKVAQVIELTQKALDEGVNPHAVLDWGLIPAMDIVGSKFSCHEFYIPEMLIAARAMQAGIALLKPGLAAQGGKPRGKVVIGTVKGDLHDIGKNLVALMLQGGGFEVIDLGADVPSQRFVEAVRSSQPNFVMMSALLTTTMLSMKDTIEALKAAGIRNQVKVAVGGAPVTQRFCDEIGADFYAANATGAVTMAKNLLPA